MTATATPPPPPSSPSPIPGTGVDATSTRRKGSLSQWQLIWMNFRKHRLAYTALYVLILFYSIAFLADFIAPYDSQRMDLNHLYSPPQVPRFNFSHGLYVHPLIMQQDPVTFRRLYYEDTSTYTPLRFFARSEPYLLWGLVPLERKLLSVPHDPKDVQNRNSFYFLGADKYGRDIFSRIVQGSRVSLSVGLIGIAVTFVLGMTIGGISGYVGGRTDNYIQRGIEIINAFPNLPLWLALAAVFPQDWSPLKVYFAITLVLSLLGWTGLARVVRGKILSLREEDYAVAAKLLGASHSRVLFRHLIPGFASHIIVSLTLAVPSMILGETSLSFLGLGLRSPIVSWGVMLQDCMDVQAVRYYPWLLLPVAFIVITVLCFNFLGDGLRDAADPYSSR
jgi:peptide/nickel transport system permease protein